MAMSVVMNMQRMMPSVGLLAITIIASTMSTPIHRGRFRARRPCSGGLDSSVERPSTTDVDVTVLRHEVHQRLRRVNSLVSALCDEVNQLRTNYVSIVYASAACEILRLFTQITRVKHTIHTDFRLPSCRKNVNEFFADVFRKCENDPFSLNRTHLLIHSLVHLKSLHFSLITGISFPFSGRSLLRNYFLL